VPADGWQELGYQRARRGSGTHELTIDAALWVQNLKGTILHDVALAKGQLANGVVSQDYTAVRFTCMTGLIRQSMGSSADQDQDVLKAPQVTSGSCVMVRNFFNVCIPESSMSTCAVCTTSRGSARNTHMGSLSWWWSPPNGDLNISAARRDSAYRQQRTTKLHTP
jgi:hypothetical protein